MWWGEAKNGFDNSDRGEGKNSKYIPRNDGQALNDSFDNAFAHNPQWIRIISWNEYYEHTHIEPSRMFGQKYLDIARDRIAKWKASGNTK
jgi:hypothetical protein